MLVAVEGGGRCRGGRLRQLLLLVVMVLGLVVRAVVRVHVRHTRVGRRRRQRRAGGGGASGRGDRAIGAAAHHRPMTTGGRVSLLRLARQNVHQHLAAGGLGRHRRLVRRVGVVASIVSVAAAAGAVRAGADVQVGRGWFAAINYGKERERPEDIIKLERHTIVNGCN